MRTAHSRALDPMSELVSRAPSDAKSSSPASSSGKGASGSVWPRAVPKDDRDVVTPRRRQPTPGRWRRRRRLVSRLKPVLWLLLIVGSPVAAFVWLDRSPRFALQDVEVEYSDGEATAIEASGRVPRDWVAEAVAPFRGENLLRLPLHEVVARLDVHPWVKTVGVSKELPTRLGVKIVERREVALLRDGEDLYYLDQEGEIIAPVEGDVPPLVTIALAGPWGRPRAALALLSELETAAPVWLNGLESIVVLEENDFVLSTTELPYPLVVRSGEIVDKVRRLREVLPDIMAQTGAGAAIDLRFERRIIIQPSAGRAVEILEQGISGGVNGRQS